MNLNRTTASLPQTRPIKVLQFGEGNFLRAFADWMIDLMNEKTGFNGAVQVIQPIQQGTGELINAQEGLYHVLLNGIVRDQAFRELRLVSGVSGVLNPYQDFHGFLKLAENPDLKFILSNTTEAGIVFSDKDTSPDTLAGTFPGKVAQLLYHRFKFFKGSAEQAITLLPCELIDKNGDALKKTVSQYAALWNLPRDFEKWIHDHTAFCNTLVDRIVPGFPKDSILELHSETGFDDNAMVMAEPFHLWVIEAPEGFEKTFPAQKAGLNVKLVKDLSPYRTRKVRILNGAHTALVPVAYLKGLRTVRESIEDHAIGKFVREVLFEEIIPTLDLPPSELKQFADDVIERFRNPFIRHELSSIALNSISKFKVRVLPSLLRYIEVKRQLPDRLMLSLAALILFYKGSWRGESTPVNDSPDIINFFKESWKAGDIEETCQQILSNTSFWGQDLGKIEGFTDAVCEKIKQLESESR